MREVWIKLEITTPAEFVDPLCSFLDDLGVEGCYQETNIDSSDNSEENWQGHDWAPTPSREGEVLIAHIPQDIRYKKTIAALESYLKELQELFPTGVSFSLSSEIIENPDWSEGWKKYFKPLRIGKNIIIKPSWERLEDTPAPIVIEIDPGMAFGTGQHASTRLCLEAMETLLSSQRQEAWRMLDLGTGTGILSIYGAKAGITSILAIDADRNAIAIARENAILNRVTDSITFRTQSISESEGSFELLVANLTSKILIENRHSIFALLERGGYLIISGILEANTEELERAFVMDFGKICQKTSSDGWVCYTLKKEDC